LNTEINDKCHNYKIDGTTNKTAPHNFGVSDLDVGTLEVCGADKNTDNWINNIVNKGGNEFGY